MDISKYEYFKTKLGTLYCCDCLTILPHLEPVDLVLTDPPYGINENNDKNLSRENVAKPKNYGFYNWDTEKISADMIRTIINKSKNQIIFGGNYYADVLGSTNCWIVWDKLNTGDFADCELAWTSFSSAVRKISVRCNGMIRESKEEKVHPTQKPMMLFLQILEKYSSDNDSILDPFFGGGTTGVACERLKRQWIGIEISEKYCEIAKKRIEKEISQLKMF